MKVSRHCFKKMQYTQMQARMAVKNMKLRPKHDHSQLLEPYLCQYCHCWHIGRRKKGQ